MPIFNYDLSGSLGGPIIKDKLWFFSTLALENSKNRGTFIPTVIDGKFSTTSMTSRTGSSTDS